MKKYMVLPLTVYGSWVESKDDALSEAKQNATKYEEDFVVVEVEFVGGFERVSPIRMDTDPHPPKGPTTTAEAIRMHGLNYDLGDENNPTFETPSRVK